LADDQTGEEHGNPEKQFCGRDHEGPLRVAIRDGRRGEFRVAVGKLTFDLVKSAFFVV
jgi:hypothetical protein